jgi:ribosome biogenesis GTPase
MTRLSKFGFKGTDQNGTARVVSAHGDYYHLVCNETEGAIVARKKKSNFLNSPIQPITGDFVKFNYNPVGESMITEVLPRFSIFERRDPTSRRKAQVLAVNFDTLFIMMGLNEDYSIQRLQRFLSLAESVGQAEVIVVLTKTDLNYELDPLPEIPNRVIRISCKTFEGIDSIKEVVRPQSTVAFIGSSGVGKSTLLNTLAGEEYAATQQTQQWSGKGRHTTTSRELVMLPDGSMVIDTPGVREIGRIGEDEIIISKGNSSHRYRIKSENMI